MSPNAALALMEAPMPPATHSVASELLGALHVAPDAVIDFAGGLLGFPECHRFALVPAGREGLFWLQSLDYSALTFLLGYPNTPIRSEQGLYDLARWARPLGPLAEGRKYCLKIPSALGGHYGRDNFATVPLPAPQRSRSSVTNSNPSGTAYTRFRLVSLGPRRVTVAVRV